MYLPLPKSLTIKESNIDGLGLFAKEFIPANTNLGMSHLFDERFEDSYIRTPLGGFFNHSETPNCKVVYQDIPYKHISLITCCDINIGDELTATYTLYNPSEATQTPSYELRGYGIMPYNIKPIQAGIQYSHAIVEYVVENYGVESFLKFLEWGKLYKTAVLLNGGTSNHTSNRYSDEEYIGSMEGHLQAFKDNNILVSTFYEPDMNDMLSGIFLIVDERVFNKRKYPDYGYYYDDTIKKFLKEEWWEANMKPTNEWIESIGGEKNYFLRQYLSTLDLWK